MKRAKPPIINRQYVVYSYKCDRCDGGYVGFTRRHPHQRVEEHKRTSIGKLLEQKHNLEANSVDLKLFSILKKYQSKRDCHNYEMYVFFFFSLENLNRILTFSLFTYRKTMLSRSLYSLFLKYVTAFFAFFNTIFIIFILNTSSHFTLTFELDNAVVGR